MTDGEELSLEQIRKFLPARGQFKFRSLNRGETYGRLGAWSVRGYFPGRPRLRWIGWTS